MSENPGRAAITFDTPTITYKTWSTWQITYEVGPVGLGNGTFLAVTFPGMSTPPQTTDPGGAGYLTVGCSDRNVALGIELCRDPRLDAAFGKERLDRLGGRANRRQIRIRPIGRRLLAGETLTVTYGDQSLGGPGARISNCLNLYRYEVRVELGEENTGELQAVCEPLPVHMQREKPGKLQVFAPSIVAVGEPFSLTLSILDDRGADLPREYAGTVNLRSSVPSDAIKRDYAFPRGAPPFARIPELRAHGPGSRTILAADPRSGLSAKSNPILSLGEPPLYRLFWGSIHPHTGLSLDVRLAGNAMNRPEDTYEYSRDVAGLDFAAVTDHALGQPDEEDFTPEEWEKTREAAAAFNQPHRFVTFSAFEFSSERFGDRNVYFLSDDMPLARMDRLQDFYSYYRGTKTIIIPHHVAVMRPVDWRVHDEELEPLVEIYSSHGRCEYYGNTPHTPRHEMRPGNSYQDALGLGYRMGVVAGSDDHSGRGGTYGLAAVWAQELTREAIFDALRRRRCHATTNARIIVDFRIDGHMMGEEIALTEAPKITGLVVGTTKLEKIEIIRNGKPVLAVAGADTSQDFQYVDNDARSGTSYYYVRVQQHDMEMAWSSPIWVKML